MCERRRTRRAGGSAEGLLRLNRRKVRQNSGQPHRPLGAPNSGYNDCRPTVGPPRGWTGAIHNKPGWQLRGGRRICCPENFRRVLRAVSVASAALADAARAPKVQPGYDSRPGAGPVGLSVHSGAGQPISPEGNERKAGRMHGRNPVLRSGSAFWRNRRALSQLHQSLPRKPAEHDSCAAEAESS